MTTAEALAGVYDLNGYFNDGASEISTGILFIWMVDCGILQLCAQKEEEQGMGFIIKIDS